MWLNPRFSYHSIQEELPEEDQVFFLFMILEKMYQLVKFLICLTYLQSKKENQLKKKKLIDDNNLSSYFQFQPSMLRTLTSSTNRTHFCQHVNWST